jgi:NAD(P)-dependent dehydrogenase (short-subunit alcohol dehydrogenase family)
MSKAAALMATKQMAHELTPKYGITVFSVSPNKLAGTEMSRQIEANVQKVRGWTPEFAREYQKKALMHGLETPPQAVADTIANLVSSGNMLYLSGCDIPFGK